MLTRFDHVQVAAPEACEAAARGFYGGLLELEELEKPSGLAGRGGCWFRIGTQELHVGVEQAFRPALKAHPGFAAESVEALQKLADRLTAAGVEVVWADPAEIPGRPRFHAADPFGNRLEFLA